MPPAGKFGRLYEAPKVKGHGGVSVSTFNEQALPLVIEADWSTDLVVWVRLNRDDLRRKLYQHGALLLRAPYKPDFAATVSAFTDNLVDYRGGAAIRNRVDSDTYTASEYPSELEIRLHSEFSHAHDWPMILFFHCDHIVPNCGGQTPIADNRRILAQMPHAIRRQFEERGLTYRRGYGFNRTWQRSYETDSRAEVEAICAAENRRCEWFGDDQLRSYETRPAVATHPITKEQVWFNYAHGFHISMMDSGIREALSTSEHDSYEQLWPNNVFWGDGGQIDPALIDVANDIIKNNAVLFDWRIGDILVVDNMLCAHGRRPYSGSRRILLKMAESFQATVRDRGS